MLGSLVSSHTTGWGLSGLTTEYTSIVGYTSTINKIIKVTTIKVKEALVLVVKVITITCLG